MKKLTALLLSLALVLSLAACGSTTPEAPKDNTQLPAETPTQEPAAPEEPQTGKILVVYYSASGHTRQVAQAIADAAGADLFEVIPTEVYTSDDLNWRDSSSRVNREHENEALRNISLTTTSVENWDKYDTVFIGYPIWWGIAAWPVNGFVTANDFTGKTVIPFATSTSSGMGESGTLLADMAKGGDWQEGQRFSSGASTADVQDWVSGLNLR